MSAPRRILVVEDETVVALDIRSQLERLGYEVVGTACTAKEGIERARSRRPDLVLMDIQLAGDQDGIAAAEEIRRTTGTPVVFLTAYADEASLARAKEVSPYGYIVKPFDEQDLNTSIEIALSRSRSEHALERERDNLMAILDAQRQGAVVVGDDGRISFVSQAAEYLLQCQQEDTVGERWETVLPVDRSIIDQLSEWAAAPSSTRSKIPVELAAGEGNRHVELEIVDDPRSNERFILFVYDVSDVYELRRLLDRDSAFERIIGTGRAMQVVFQLIRDVSEVDSAVLIQGETGTGKELVASAIHRRSHRSQGPFVPVNCGALSPELAASQLFGHRRGAFTGAIADHQGFFAAANQGTLFLDEIGELPGAVQPTLLRALDNGQITAVGETQTRQIDFRLITATSRSLEREIEQQEFRAELYYRMSVVRIVLPPLRERLEDLPVLARAFIAEARAKTGKPVQDVTSEAMARLLRYSWPGNVRQLKNALEFATIRSYGAVIRQDDLPPEVLAGDATPPQPANDADRIRAALAQTRGNRRKAAELLGMSRSTLYRRLEQLGLKF